MRFVKIIRLFMELHLHLHRSTHILLPLLLHHHLLIFTVFDFVTDFVAVVIATVFSRVKLFKVMIIELVFVVSSVKLSWPLQ